ncbi:MAG TPA: sialate O-acetylesterase [Pirellulales bacterium]|jgi:sialate O-acetylesterase|nr:sialate O-acetylesterase [Pirellulales bacterium]
MARNPRHLKRAIGRAVAACLAAWSIGSCGTSGRADVRLPALISDHMVLQADRPDNVWGWADAGEKVTLRIADQVRTTQADALGRWTATLDKLPVGSGLTLVVEGHNRLEVADVSVGEVWICSGQSNMGVPVIRSTGGAEAAATADFPQIRIFAVTPAGTIEPADDVGGHWEVSTPRTVRFQTAVGFFFARMLYEELKVPVGIIHSSVGGSPIEGWIDADTLDTIAALRPTTAAALERWRSQAGAIERFPAERDAWETRYGVRPPDNQGFAEGFARRDFDDRSWPIAALPASWEKIGGVHSGGVFWLRKEVTLPADAVGKPFSLLLNYMHQQYDTTYFNGVEVGGSGDKPPMFSLSERRYEVPGELVQAGKNVIAVRVVSADPRSDLMGRGFRGDYNLPIDQHLVGNEWRWHVESLLPPLPPEALKTRPRPNEAALQNTPTILYNAKIYPLIHYGIRGVVWYQGESNVARAAQYRELFALMIGAWRRHWNEGDFPFYFVQLANYLDPPDDPNERSQWAELREAQAATLANVAATGMAVAIDVGDRDNIHPANKRAVGERLARLALARTYHRPIDDAGPEYRSMSVEGDRVRLQFAHAAGLAAEGGRPRGFAIAGDDRKFVWATAQIDGESVIVSAPEVPQPRAVRYAWANNPGDVSLRNEAGLPAAPFRTDDWPLAEK